MVDVPQLRHRNLTIAECIPEDLGYLDAYQEQAFEQIILDENQRTIQSYEPRPYMLRGLLEELNEIVEIDRVEPEYSRFGAIVLLDGNEALQPGAVTDQALERHTKEFGDVSWYLANYLRTFNIRFSRTVGVGLAAWHLDRLSQPRSDIEHSLEIERRFPWIKLAAAEQELKIAAQAILGVWHDERIAYEQRLLVASGKMVTSMMQMAMTRFGLTYQEILQQNQTKLKKRMDTGTIFDKAGGDDR